MEVPGSLTRSAALRLAAGAAFASGLLSGRARAAPSRVPELRRLSVHGSRPFAGDRRLLATVSPGSPDRDRVSVAFSLARPARVTVVAVDTRQPSKPPVWRATASLPRGRHRFLWRPARTVPPGTYVLR
ncbi:MAG: hypothetical protein H0T13_02450, partial [Actinobacteria bacterium]|nr:hypothetical protein [Actinomycetota bacterium]